MGFMDTPLPYLGASLVAKFAFLYHLRNQKPPSAKQVGKITRLTLFPVKSMKGIDYEELLFTSAGQVDPCSAICDRTWMVTTEDYNFVTARQKSKLVTVTPSVHGNYLHLDVAGRGTLRLPLKMDDKRKVITSKVWGEKIEAYDCGDEAAAWISSVLGESFRIVHHAHDMKHRDVLGNKSSFHKIAKLDDKATLQDQTAFHILSEASVADLNTRLDKPVSMNNFRPTLVVSGCDAYREDDFKQVFVGGARMSTLKLCNRCLFTTVDPVAGTKADDMEPLKTLRTYRRLVEEYGDSPCFGVNLVLDRAGRVKVGDAVYATM